MNLDFQLTPKQQEFLQSANKFLYTLYGGAKGGGKSRGLRDILILRRFQYPGSYGYLFRKTYPELKRNHIDKLLAENKLLRPYYHKTDRAIYLPNGSVLYFAYCDHYDDLENFQGVEINDLGIEEAGEWHEEWIQKLSLSVRSSNPDIPISVLLTANPGGISHKYLKRLFVDKDYQDEEDPKDYNFIQAKVDDNPALTRADPSYKWRMKSNIKDPMMRRALIDGDWDIVAGIFFEEFRRQIHVVEPFQCPEHWSWGFSYDYGYNHPFSFGVWRIDEDGIEYRVAEASQSHCQIKEQAEIMKELTGRKVLTGVVAGLDCWHKGQNKAINRGPTIAEEFAKHQIHLVKATVDRKQGAAQIRNGLHYTFKENSDGKKIRIGPTTFFFSSCKIGIDHIERMTHNPKDLEDVLKVDATNGDPFTGDDAYDEIRYFRMSRPRQAQMPEPKLKKTYEYGSRHKRNKRNWQTV